MSTRFKLYVPGLLSLCFLFPLLLKELSGLERFPKYNMLEVSWHDPRNGSPYQNSVLQARVFTDIKLTGSRYSDDFKIAYTKFALREMMNQSDLKKGIRLTFEDSAKYSSWVELIDFCNQCERLRYIAYEDELWIFSAPVQEELTCRLLSGCMVMARIKSPEINYAWNYTAYLDRKLWPVGFAFVLLCIFMLRRRNS